MPSNNSHVTLHTRKYSYWTPGTNIIMLGSARARALTHTHTQQPRSYSVWMNTIKQVEQITHTHTQIHIHIYTHTHSNYLQIYSLSMNTIKQVAQIISKQIWSSELFETSDRKATSGHVDKHSELKRRSGRSRRVARASRVYQCALCWRQILLPSSSIWARADTEKHPLI